MNLNLSLFFYPFSVYLCSLIFLFIHMFASGYKAIFTHKFDVFQAIFTAGYKAVLHIHAIVEECEIVELMQQIDPKTKKPMKKKPLFVKNGAVVVCRVQVS